MHETTGGANRPRMRFGRWRARRPAISALLTVGLCLLTTRAAAEVVTVTNAGDDVNGDVSSPAALIVDPGPDGISLREAMEAAEATPEHDTIRFDPSLTGAVIALGNGLPCIVQGNVTVDGDIDYDMVPDVTIDGSSTSNESGFRTMGGSDVWIEGLVITGFSNNGVEINPDAAGGSPVVENVTVRHCTLSGNGSATVKISIWDQSDTAVRNVEIIGNTLEYCPRGVDLTAGLGGVASDNEISSVLIVGNTFTQISPYAVMVMTSSAADICRNTVSDVEIRRNTITGGSGILVDAANQSDTNDHTIDGLVIADNQFDAEPISIEIVSVGEDGTNATGNVVSNTSITDNVFLNGGIQISGATGNNCTGNTISGIVIDRNHLSSCVANGVYLVAASGGGYENLMENVVIRNTFVDDSEGAGILLHAPDSGSPDNTMDNISIANVTLVNNGNPSWAGGLNINTLHSSNVITGVTVHSSILWGNSGSDAIRGSLAPDTVACCVLNDPRFTGSDGNNYTPPQFVDSGSGDYRLDPASPCVDTGDPAATNAGDSDLDGAVRVWDGDGDTVTVVDRGAWEHGAPPAPDGDCNDDGMCDATDLAWVIACAPGSDCTCPGDPDLDGSGTVDGGDTDQVLACAFD